MNITEEELKAAHKCCIHHRRAIEASAACGCFFCLRVFPPDQITEWTDDEATALCPHCGIDSVLATASGIAITPPFLSAMHDYYFKR